MDARLLDMLHDAADQHVHAIAHDVDIHLHRVFQVAVEQYRGLVGHLYRILDVLFKLRLIEHDFHGPSAQYVGWPHHQGVAQTVVPSSMPRRGRGRCLPAAGAAPGSSAPR